MQFSGVGYTKGSTTGIQGPAGNYLPESRRVGTLPGRPRELEDLRTASP